MSVSLLLALVVAYLVGSIDFAVVVSRAKGVDIYQVGSGNPGAANVARALGGRYAALVMLGDAAKGLVGAWLGLLGGGTAAAGFAAGLAAVIGHVWPVWHRFRGGKGVATAFGVILRMNPLVGVALGLVYLLVVRLSGISSLGSLTAAALSIPAVALVGRRGWALVWLAAVAVLIFVRHHENIRRLMRGEERRVRGD